MRKHLGGALGLLQDPKPNIFSWAILISAHVQNGDLPEARRIFEEMPERDSVSWNTMIGAYARSGQEIESINLFLRMDLEGAQIDGVSFIGVIDACSSSRFLKWGRIIHEILYQSEWLSDTIILNAVIKMYGKCGCVEGARVTFSSMTESNVVSWTSMLSVYAQNGNLQEARQIFDHMLERNVVSWNSMLSACSQHGVHKVALESFRAMALDGVNPTGITFICVLESIAGLRRLRAGEEVHSIAVESGFVAKAIVVNALVSMYGKCGDVRKAVQMFHAIARKDVMSWNVIINVCALEDPKIGLGMYRRMDLEGMRPNVVTFVMPAVI